MSNLIVITGITGTQGGSVAKTFLNEPGWRIRGLTRNPSKPSNKWLLDAGVELVAADLDDVEAVEKAFSGANAIFAVTDFWQFMQDEKTKQMAEERGITINEACAVREGQHGRNMVVAASKTLDSLERYVWSTLSDTKKWTDGKIRHNLHFDSKAAITDYLKDNFPELDKCTSYLQVGVYMDNWKKGFPLFTPKKQEDGTFVMYSSRDPTTCKPIPWVDAASDTGTYTRALIMDARAGTTLLGYSEMMTRAEWMKLWDHVVERHSRTEVVDLAQLEKEIPSHLAQEVFDSFTYASQYGYDGGDPAVKSPKDLGIQLKDLTSLEQYIRNEDWSSIL